MSTKNRINGVFTGSSLEFIDVLDEVYKQQPQEQDKNDEDILQSEEIKNKFLKQGISFGIMVDLKTMIGFFNWYMGIIEL